MKSPKSAKIFIGYDSKEEIAYHVLCHSIIARSSIPVEITPIAIRHTKSFYNPLIARPHSTEFTYSRFLTPYLCGYEGFALFMDCDMLCLDDIAKLWEYKQECKVVSVVKHPPMSPIHKTKFLGNKQEVYPMKCWSSLMLFNCSECKGLDVGTVEEGCGQYLHQFKWINRDTDIDELPTEWNYLVGYSQLYPVDKKPSMVHYTLGGPWNTLLTPEMNRNYGAYWRMWIDEYNDMKYMPDEYARMWTDECNDMRPVS